MIIKNVEIEIRQDDLENYGFYGEYVEVYAQSVSIKKIVKSKEQAKRFIEKCGLTWKS